jgi:hypothetical protein
MEVLPKAAEINGVAADFGSRNVEFTAVQCVTG